MSTHKNSFPKLVRCRVEREPSVNVFLCVMIADKSPDAFLKMLKVISTCPSVLEELVHYLQK